MAIPETPYTRTEMYLDGIAKGDTSGIPETPYTREEAYWDAIAQGDVTLAPETPYTRKEMYLDAIAQNDGSLAPEIPYTREEMYLDAIATGEDTAPERPYTRYEMYLDEIVQGGGGEEEHTASGDIVTFTAKKAAPLKALTVSIDPVQAGTGDPSPDNVRPISGWSEVNVWVKPTYDPTANPTATLQLGQTIYGGTLDVTNGVLTVDRGMVDLTVGMSGGTMGSTYVFYKEISNPKIVPNSQIAPIISEAYIPIRYNGVSSNVNTIAVRNNGVVYVNTGSADIQPIGKAVYELATPITYQLTPQEVTTLKGVNNIWADTGDVTVTFKGTPSEDESPLNALNILLGGAYNRNGSDPSDAEALNIILGR